MLLAPRTVAGFAKNSDPASTRRVSKAEPPSSHSEFLANPATTDATRTTEFLANPATKIPTRRVSERPTCIPDESSDERWSLTHVSGCDR
ncbi:hypothetical protein RISK_001414 [Rhodopirellula islandica]|uniref:Uncharacterized protein n=1 Tax=Rhodopirellula islandica TaxID=595434 RepID=A0A0J1EM92_RHOIS|nr:hypothetical protein RISK_001414 [Rhodopirellula islandica]